MIQFSAVLLAVCPVADVGRDVSDDVIRVPSALIKIIDEVEVPGQEAGVLAIVNASEGQMVREGEVLASIDDKKAKLAVQRAKTEMAIAERQAKNDINIRFARKAVEVAEAEVRRADEANEKYPGSISETEMDRLRLTVQKLKLEVEQAEHEVETAADTLEIKKNDYEVAQEDVRRRQILAPLDGVVVQVSRHRGEWVEPGEMVVRLQRINQLRAEGFVQVDDLQHGLERRDVVLYVTLPGGKKAEFPGRIVFIEPEIDPVNAEVRVWAEVENTNLKLRPGMRADVHIDLSKKRG